MKLDKERIEAIMPNCHDNPITNMITRKCQKVNI